VTKLVIDSCPGIDWQTLFERCSNIGYLRVTGIDMEGDGNLLNHHLAVCHSLLEDTIIFAAIGVPVLWVVPTRLFFAIVVVWILRGYSYMYARKVKHIYE
jgi:hypothetical protein